ncbi:hypothetical protein H7J88_14830 [Mycolicibacterium flavescens]|uniref:Proline rich protein n=1 Tax=Mycolicibacterium flavescens TaxID=1776 RepID=A0A1E3REU8_MYCFV|nr:hypothetical protein [Mycolicibacterium flavescens]MCV7280918.1 hypothetical protein [Mycolicibacterium flavescens]ODQ88405.1 hypothetical protein BHQ18_19935 [Mycolicibacterium flavescens]
MSETTSSPEPATTPVVVPPNRPSRLTSVAAWVGIVAGVVFIVAVIFFSGFVLGAKSAGHRGGHHGGHDRDAVMFHRGPPPMFPMGPRGEFNRPPFGGGTDGPGAEQPPTTTAPARP